MTPSEVKNYLAERRIVPLKDIALHFDLPPDAIRGMLEPWLRKGRVRQHLESACQDGGCCGGCAEDSKEIYEWI